MSGIIRNERLEQIFADHKIMDYPYLYWSNSVTNWLATNEWKDIGKDRGKDSGKDGVGVEGDDFPVPGK